MVDIDIGNIYSLGGFKVVYVSLYGIVVVVLVYIEVLCYELMWLFVFVDNIYLLGQIFCYEQVVEFFEFIVQVVVDGIDGGRYVCLVKNRVVLVVQFKGFVYGFWFIEFSFQVCYKLCLNIGVFCIVVFGFIIDLKVDYCWVVGCSFYLFVNDMFGMELESWIGNIYNLLGVIGVLFVFVGE